MPTIREYFARERLRTMTAVGTEAGVVKEWDTRHGEGQAAQPGDPAQQERPQLPLHTVDVTRPAGTAPEQAQQQSLFLQHAAGGPSHGFVTRNVASHAVAHQLARSGHLQHLGSYPQGKSTVHHWALTPKGHSASGFGRKPGGGGGGGFRHAGGFGHPGGGGFGRGRR